LPRDLYRCVKTILLVDSDLGFAFWLGHALDQAGFDALPARNTSDATALLSELKVAVDLIVIRASMPSAKSLAEDLRGQFGPHFKVLAVLERGTEEDVSGWADAKIPEPTVIDEASRIALVSTIRKMALDEAAGG